MMNAEIAVQEGERLHSQLARTQASEAWMQRIEQHSEWPLLSRLPMRLSARIPVAGFRIADLLALAAGQVIESGWASTQDVSLTTGGVQLFWSEFEVVEQRMAVRLTRLA